MVSWVPRCCPLPSLRRSFPPKNAMPLGVVGLEGGVPGRKDGGMVESLCNQSGKG